MCNLAPAPSAPFCQAIEAGGWIFVSGQRPVDSATGKIDEDFKRQARQVLANISAILRQAGLSMSNIVRTTVYLNDIADFGEMNDVYAEFFEEPFPARTTVGAELRGIKIEIDAIAVRKN
jgi:2-iminobutanoate/2-iminopropanoate deaminase